MSSFCWNNIEDVKFNDIEDGKVIDSVTYEEINPMKAIKMGERYYDRDTILNMIRSDNLKDPYNSEMDVSHLKLSIESEGEKVAKYRSFEFNYFFIRLITCVLIVVIIIFIIFVSFAGYGSENGSDKYNNWFVAIVFLSFALIFFS